jgi:DNA invertase Pin-like site-specific DNA recombinase
VNDRLGSNVGNQALNLFRIRQLGPSGFGTARQLLRGLPVDALEDAGAARIFSDHGVSGSKARRPQLDACLDHLREGDVLTVWKLDRLGRNTQHVLALVDELTSRKIGFRSITEGLHTDGPMGKAMLTIMAAFATLERDTMIERTRAGLAAAAANGRKGGRPRKINDAAAAKARSLRAKGIAATDIAKMLAVSRATVYRYLSDGASLVA